MSRSDYIEDWDEGYWPFIRWRGAVKSAMRGKRGQRLLRELLSALDAMPEKKLIAEELVTEDGSYCALGVLGAKRGIDMKNIDPEEYEQVAGAFDCAPALVREIVYENDEYMSWNTPDGPEKRWRHMRAWVEKHIIPLSQ